MTHGLLTNMLAQTFWLPSAGSESAETYHSVFNLILYVTGFFFLLVVVLMLYFVVRYRRRSPQEIPAADAPTHNTVLEIAWTGIPLVIVIFIFVLGFRGYMNLEQPPSNAEPITVMAQKWSFSFEYKNGAISNNLYVPVGQPVVLNLTSKDVLHSLYIPVFGVQKNLIPQRTTQLWFTAKTITPMDKPNVLFCTQYCGNAHSQMGSGGGEVGSDMASYCYVLSQADYDAKMAELNNLFVDPATKKNRPLREVGAKLFMTSGCASCHSLDGTENIGPTYKGLYKSVVEYTTSEGASGTLRVSDSDADWDAYLRESILQPGAKVVKGKQNVMGSFATQFSGSPAKDKKLEAINEFIKSLGPNYKPLPDPVPETTTAPATAPAAPGIK